MFKELIEAFDAIGQYCHFKCGDGQPFYPTEVYSEGTMLKLVVAKLQEVATESIIGDKIIREIANAAKCGWMCEGRMRSAFKNEGATRADAIVGNLAVQSGTRWRMTLSTQKPTEVRCYVLEAKMGSGLSSDTKATHGKDGFNQAARNIACIAAAACEAKVTRDIFDGRFYVIAPKKNDNCASIKDLISVSPKIIEREIDKKDPRHLFRQEFEKKDFMDFVNSIATNSCLLYWDDIIGAIPDNGQKLFEFYGKCKTLIAK